MAATERENALKMLLRTGEPEWVPFLPEYTPGRAIIPTAVRERPKWGNDGYDWYGCYWTYDEPTHGFVQDPRRGWPVDDITDWRNQVKFPDYDAIDWETCAAEDEKGYDRKNKLIRFMIESGPFERLHSLVGLEEAMISMYTEPEAFKELIEAITDSKIELIDRLAKYYRPDALCINDDMGGAGGPLISLDMYREFIKPSHKRIAEALKRNNIIYVHHSCGKMQDFIDEFIDNGVQVLHPIQSMNDRKMIAEKYAGKVSFEVSLPVECSRMDVTDETIRAGVRQIVDTFGPYKNFVIAPSGQRAGLVDVISDELKRCGRDYYKKT